VVVFTFILAWGIDPTWTWLLFPLVLVLLFVLTTAVSMIVSSLYPRFRDTAILWSVAATVLFYASPVLYPVEKLPSTIGDILQLNPFTPLLELARVWVIDPTAPTPIEVAGGFVHLLPAIAIYLATCIFAVWTFRREAPRIAEQL
jgi:ABC-type polysaccharide/polyol phosphate export permease